MCFNKIEYRHCGDEIYVGVEKSTNLVDALTQCAADKNCGKVEDFFCDNIGPYPFCYASSTDYVSGGTGNTCIFVKETSCNYTLYIQIFYMIYIFKLYVS